MASPSLSVVIPVYNVEQYLDGCLETVVGQTLANLDVVCVNDGATDSSPRMLEEWQRRDPRIRVVNKENGGLSSARNAGIQVARGAYVCFLDSDDLLEPNAAEEIVRLLETTRADVLCFGATYFPESPRNAWLDDVLSPRDVIYDAFDMDIILKESSRPFSWRMAFRTDFLRDNKLYFDEDIPFGEDQAHCFSVYPRAKKIALSSKKLYRYRRARPGSLMDRLKDDPRAKMLAHVNIVDHIFQDWQGLGILGEHADDMMPWALDFVLDGLMAAPQSTYLTVCDKLAECFQHYFKPEDAQRIKSGADRRLATNLLTRRRDLPFLRKYAAKDFYCKRHGIQPTGNWLMTSWYLH